MDLHELRGSQMRQRIDEFEKTGGKLTEVTVAWWQQSGIDANKDRLLEIATIK